MRRRARPPRASACALASAAACAEGGPAARRWLRGRGPRSASDIRRARLPSAARALVRAARCCSRVRLGVGQGTTARHAELGLRCGWGEQAEARHGAFCARTRASALRREVGLGVAAAPVNSAERGGRPSAAVRSRRPRAAAAPARHSSTEASEHRQRSCSRPTRFARSPCRASRAARGEAVARSRSRAASAVISPRRVGERIAEARSARYEDRRQRDAVTGPPAPAR